MGDSKYGRTKRGRPVVVTTPAPPSVDDSPELSLEGLPAEVTELLHLLTNALSGTPVDIEAAQAAVFEVLDKYDIKIHTFLIAVARSKFARVERTLSFIDRVETRLFMQSRLENASTNELLQMYRIAQSGMLDSLAYIERTLKLRDQLDPASGGRMFVDAISQTTDLKDIELLTPAQRDKARTTLGRLLSGGEDGSSGDK